MQVPIAAKNQGGYSGMDKLSDLRSRGRQFDPMHCTTDMNLSEVGGFNENTSTYVVVDPRW